MYFNESSACVPYHLRVECVAVTMPLVVASINKIFHCLHGYFAWVVLLLHTDHSQLSVVSGRCVRSHILLFSPQNSFFYWDAADRFKQHVSATFYLLLNASSTTYMIVNNFIISSSLSPLSLSLSLSLFLSFSLSLFRLF